MIPIELEVRNFLAYRQPGPLRFEGMHIACLAGPNGAGKSSVLDAITWALWGKARALSPDDLIYQGQTEMQVVLVFGQDGARYRVLRQRKAGKRGASLLELQSWDEVTGGWRGLSEAGIRETQDKIERLIRLDYETFVNSAFLMQGRADEFTTKTPMQRKQVLANILGLHRWEAYEERAKGRIQETRAAMQRLEGRLEEIERELAQRDRYQSELEAAEREAAQAGATLQQAEKQWSDLENTRHELVRLQRQVDEATKRISAREAELTAGRREADVVRERADKGKAVRELEAVRQALQALEPLQAELEAVTAATTRLAEEAGGLRGINLALVPETEPLKQRASVLESASDPTCPTCGQPLTDEHRHQLLASLQQELATRRDQYRENQGHLRELEGELGRMEAEKADLGARLRQRTTLDRRLGELQTALEHADQAAEQLLGLEAKLERWTQELQQEKTEREQAEAQADNCERILRAAPWTREGIESLRLARRLTDERVGAARQQLAALQTFEMQRRERRAEREVRLEELALLEDLREAFGKRGVPAMIIETAVPELERYANELLTRISDGRLNVRIETQRETKAGDLREALDIIISDELGSRAYELYSGGEAFRINFAIRIGLSRLLAQRAGAQLRSLFIDEGFGTQDARGREQLVGAINSIQEDFDLILVITHIEELKDAFPARIEISKTAQGSQFSLV
ncbi:MAG: SMC family ATPase [Anaerolineales bacterium]|nr:SMC family ATPase [Anaerolineales bacterium]